MSRRLKIRFALRPRSRRHADAPHHAYAQAPEKKTWQPLHTRVSSWIVIAIVLFFCLKGAPPHTNPAGRADLYVSTANNLSAHIAVGCMLLVGIPLMFRRWWPTFSLSFFSCAAAVIPVLICLSTAWSYYPSSTFAKSILTAFQFCFAGYIVSRYSTNEMLRLLRLTNRAAILLSLVVIAALPAYGLGYDNEWRGIFAHKNDLGIFILFLSVAEIVAPTYSKGGRRWRNFFLLLDALLCGMSESRSAWALAAAGLMVYFLVTSIRRFRSTDRKPLLVATVTTMIVLAAGVLSFRDELTRMVGKDPSFSGRTQIWHAVGQAIAVHPLLGYGYGGFWRELTGPSISIMESIGFTVAQSHEGYLEILLQLGFVGLGLVVLVILLAVRDLLTCLREDGSPLALWAGGILMFTVMANFAEAYLLFENEITTLLLFMACLALRRRARLIRSARPVVLRHYLAHPATVPELASAAVRSR